jgi:Mce-associated membrane protein
VATDDADGVSTSRDAVDRARLRAQRAREAADLAEAAAAAAEEAAAAADRAQAAAQALEADDEDALGEPVGKVEAVSLEKTDDEPVEDGDTDETDEVDEVDEADGKDEAVSEKSVADRGFGAALAGLATTRPTRATLIAAATAVLLIAAVVVNAVLFFQHRSAVDEQKRLDAFVVAARQGVVNMTSIDHTRAKADVDRVLAQSTGDFKADFLKRSRDFVDVVQKSQVTTKGQVSEAGVEKVNPDGSVVVLVASTSKVTNAAGAKDEDRSWRLRVTMVAGKAGPKMAKVEFVP